MATNEMEIEEKNKKLDMKKMNNDDKTFLALAPKHTQHHLRDINVMILVMI